ncbi:hypothetical protein [Flexivirga caeni]|nr:hypothetical protein [Flexivirga caeni]
MSIVALVVTLLPILVFVVVAVVVVRASKGAPPRGGAGYDVATGSGTWFARVRQPGLHLGGWGQLRVYGGQVSYTPHGSRAPAWTSLASQLRVVRPSALETSFTAEVPQVGRVLIEPSTSKLARWRSAGWQGSDYRTTQDVVTILQGWGAHC